MADTTTPKPVHIKLQPAPGQLLRERAAKLGEERNMGKAVDMTDYIIEASNYFEAHRGKK